MKVSRVLIYFILLLLLSSTPALSQQRRQSKRQPPTIKAKPQVQPEPTLDEILRALKTHLMLSARYQTDKHAYRVSVVDFDECKFLFEIKYDSIRSSDEPYKNTTRYTGSFRYLGPQIVIRKEGLGEPTLVTFNADEGRKVILVTHSAQLGTFRENTTEAIAVLQLGFEEKDAAKIAASLVTTAIKLCQ